MRGRKNCKWHALAFFSSSNYSRKIEKSINNRDLFVRKDEQRFVRKFFLKSNKLSIRISNNRYIFMETTMMNTPELSTIDTPPLDW